MDILDSVEIRWFLPKDHPSISIASACFEAAAAEGERVDHYLATDRDDLGFKARLVKDQPAKVETKYRLGFIDGVALVPQLAGTVERWRKLSLTLDDPELRSKGLWVTVHKERRLRKLARIDGVMKEISVKERPDAGCTIEMVALGDDKSKGPPFAAWSLGLEAFGPEETLFDTLQATCRIAFATAPKLVLDSKLSMGYPAWVRAQALARR